MRKIKYIINPAAGQGESKHTINLIHDKMIASDVMYSISISSYEGHVEILAREAAQDGYTDVVAVGGDGTVLEVFNGIFERNINLGIIPAGTGNDFVRMLNMTKNFEESIDRIIRGNTCRVDIGVVNDTHFLNVVGMGIDGDIVSKTEVVKKKIKGSAAYLYSTFASLLNYKCKEVTINIDGNIYHRKVYLVAIGNGQYFGGGMKITPGAKLDSKNFEVVVINEMKKSKFAVLFRKVFSGKHIHEKPVEVFYGKNIKVKSDDSILINADGNIIGNGTAEIHIMPEAQNVII